MGGSRPKGAMFLSYISAQINVLDFIGDFERLIPGPPGKPGETGGAKDEALFSHIYRTKLILLILLNNFYRLTYI